MSRRWSFHLVNFDYEKRETEQQTHEIETVGSFHGYEEYLGEQLASARDDFNAAINWAITSLGVTLGLILTASSFPNFGSWLLVLVLITFCSHFATRSARGYLNIIRWALILRRVTQFYVAQRMGKASAELNLIKSSITEAITTYHIQWSSPITRKELVLKILFEFGFGYFFLILTGLLIWIATSVSLSLEYIVTGFVGAIFVFLEWRMLLHSLYLKRVVVAQEARFLLYGQE